MRPASRWRIAARAGGWLGVYGCVGLTGCISDELVKTVFAENIALTAASVVQAITNVVLNPFFSGLTT